FRPSRGWPPRWYSPRAEDYSSTLRTGCHGSLAVLFAAFAWFVHQDGRTTYGYVPSTAQVVSVTGVAAALVLIAFSRIGRPLAPRPREWTPGWDPGRPGLGHVSGSSEAARARFTSLAMVLAATGV